MRYVELARYEGCCKTFGDIVATANQVLAGLGLPEDAVATVGVMEPETNDYRLWCAPVTVVRRTEPPKVAVA